VLAPTQEIALIANAVNLLSAADAGHGDGGFHAPTLDEFFPPAIFFEGTPFELNRIMLVRLFAIAVMLLLFWLALRKGRLIPTRGQSIAELGLDFVRIQIVEEILGERLGRKYLPILAAMFFGIFAMNITGIIPGLNIAGTSVVAMPLLLAVVAYVMFIYAGIREAGTGTFFRNALFPPGVPWPMYILLTPIEFINIFIVRPISLALRLLLNMMVGHLLLVLCFAATHFFFFSMSGGFMAFGALTLIGGFVMTIVEMAVAILQAYVFTLLASVYIQQAAAKEH
jgi:F-type H+-transporting ATPase subunit a